jgi:ribosome-associated translation inhibitor RaiA
VVRRVQWQLRRLGAALSTIVVRLSDVNGPKGGVDKRCQIILVRAGQPSITVEELNTDAYAAVDGAVERASRTAVKGMARARTTRRRARRSRRASLVPAVA